MRPGTAAAACKHECVSSESCSRGLMAPPFSRGVWVVIVLFPEKSVLFCEDCSAKMLKNQYQAQCCLQNIVLLE